MAKVYLDSRLPRFLHGDARERGSLQQSLSESDNLNTILDSMGLNVEESHVKCLQERRGERPWEVAVVTRFFFKRS